MDKFSDITTTSYGENIQKSISALFVGLILFLGSFCLLWLNEGRSVNQMKKNDFIKKNATVVASNSIDRSNDGKLIVTSGQVFSNETLSDSIVSVKNAIVLKRDVQMYQWYENKTTHKEHKKGGSSVTKTEYSYDKRWSNVRIDSEKFYRPEYRNPEFVIKEKTVAAEHSKLGAYNFNYSQAEKVVPSKQIKNLPSIKGYKKFDGVYYSSKNPSYPEIGDLRIKYSYAPSGTYVSVVGQQKATDSISSFPSKFGSIYLQYDGDLSMQQILLAHKQENAIITNLLRILGFIMMFGGLYTLTNPIIVIASYIPMLSYITEMFSLFFITCISIILSLLTISIAWFVYRPLLSIDLIVIVCLVVIYLKSYLAKKKEEKIVVAEK